jgi:peptidase E
MRKKTLVMGGSPLDAERPAMEKYLISLTGKARPKVCFLPTASADADTSIIKFLTVFERVGAHPSFLRLFARMVEDIPSFLLGFDLIYLGGGNTANMMAVWKAQGVEEVLFEAWRRGIVIAGGSAGAICWYESGVTDSFGRILKPLTACYGVLEGSHCPHYHWKDRREVYHHLLMEEKLPAGTALDDLAAIRYEDTTLAEVVAAGPNAHAFWVEKKGGRIREQRLRARRID